MCQDTCRIQRCRGITETVKLEVDEGEFPGFPLGTAAMSTSMALVHLPRDQSSMLIATDSCRFVRLINGKWEFLHTLEKYGPW